MLDPDTNSAKNKEQRRHALLPVNQFQNPVFSGAGDNASEKVLRSIRRIVVAQFIVDIAEKLLNLLCLPYKLALIIGHHIKILENIVNVDGLAINNLVAHISLPILNM